MRLFCSCVYGGWKSLWGKTTGAGSWVTTEHSCVIQPLSLHTHTHTHTLSIFFPTLSSSFLTLFCKHPGSDCWLSECDRKLRHFQLSVYIGRFVLLNSFAQAAYSSTPGAHNEDPDISQVRILQNHLLMFMGFSGWQDSGGRQESRGREKGTGSGHKRQNKISLNKLNALT